MSGRAPVLPKGLGRDQLWILGCLIALVGLSWWYLILDAAAMGGMGMASMDYRPWDGREFVAMFLMWAIMMVAMMVPSATPLILLHAKVQRQREQHSAVAPALAISGGYIAVWTLFSLFATLLQWRLESLALLSPMMKNTNWLLGAGLLLAAGVYQLTPLKTACLAHCRSPLQYLMTHWRAGTAGAFQMGLHHGLYCVGCCWFLMGLLFVGGVMNLLWILALSLFVIAEKLIPRGQFLSRVSGLGLLIAAAGLALDASLPG